MKSQFEQDIFHSEVPLNNKYFYDRVVKRIGDIIFSFLVLLIGCPFFLLIALLVKLSSPGPVFYKQRRLGYKQVYFDCIKFRTMHSEADSLLEKLLENNLLLKEEFENDFKLRNDPRITPIGKLLRLSSLDELPQFINVIQGHMTVVGPRPIVEDEIEKYGENMQEVFSVRPGITGLWQVSGRNNLTYKRRVYLDIIYVRNRSLIMDLGIILRTFGVLLFPRDRGAY